MTGLLVGAKWQQHTGQKRGKKMRSNYSEAGVARGRGEIYTVRP
jgi:hypothetical protein